MEALFSIWLVVGIIWTVVALVPCVLIGSEVLFNKNMSEQPYYLRYEEYLKQSIEDFKRALFFLAVGPVWPLLIVVVPVVFFTKVFKVVFAKPQEEVTNV